MRGKNAHPDPDMTFETAVERLESIVEAMESDKLPLSDLLVRYEEGTKLVKYCQDQLNVAEKRIEVITRNAKGEPQVEPFDPAAPLAPTPAPAPKAKKVEEDISLF